MTTRPLIHFHFCLTATTPPTFGVLATWNAATLGAGGGWHGWTDLGLSDAMPAALAAHGAFVVNEAYSLVQGCRAPRRN